MMVLNHSFKKGLKPYNPIPGSELYIESEEAFKKWLLSGKARYGPEYEHKKCANARFKFAVCFIKRNEQAMRANSMHKKLLQNNLYEFWKEAVNNSKTPLAASPDGISGAENVVEM